MMLVDYGLEKERISLLTVITTKALSAPDKTIDLGCRIAIRAAIINVSSPI